MAAATTIRFFMAAHPEGGHGNDVLYGGALNGIFAYLNLSDSTAAQEADHVHDFEDGDRIDVSALGAADFFRFTVTSLSGDAFELNDDRSNFVPNVTATGGLDADDRIFAA